MRTPTLLAACLCILLAFQSNAQVQKSDQNLGFGFDVSSLGGDFGESRMNLYLTYSYYFTKNLSVGVGPRYGWNTANSPTSDPNAATTSKTKNTLFGYNVFLNYNLLTNNAFMLPYFGAQYTNVLRKEESAGNTSEVSLTSVGGNVGIKFFVTERFNVDNNFSVTRVLSAKDGGQKIGGDATVLQINVGLGYIIGRRN